MEDIGYKGKTLLLVAVETQTLQRLKTPQPKITQLVGKFSDKEIKGIHCVNNKTKLFLKHQINQTHKKWQSVGLKRKMLFEDSHYTEIN